MLVTFCVFDDILNLLHGYLLFLGWTRICPQKQDLTWLVLGRELRNLGYLKFLHNRERAS